jgi:hypothetical protein
MKSIHWLYLGCFVGLSSIFTASLNPFLGGVQIIVMVGIMAKSVTTLQDE